MVVEDTQAVPVVAGSLEEVADTGRAAVDLADMHHVVAVAAAVVGCGAAVDRRPLLER